MLKILSFALILLLILAPTSKFAVDIVHNDPRIADSWNIDESSLIDVSVGQDLCHILPTDYHFLAARFRWLDADHVIFSVSNGEAPGGIFEPRKAWYQYQPLPDTLTKIENPFAEIGLQTDTLALLTNLQSGQDGQYQFVEISPDNRQIIYPRNIGGKSTYWLLDVKREKYIDLGLSYNERVPLEIFWASSTSEFILQWKYWGAGSEYPANLVHMNGEKVVIQPLSSLSVFSYYRTSMVFANSRIMGISSDGTYLVMHPETVENLAWLVNLQDNTITTLNFTPQGDRKVIWTDDTTFAAVTDLGVVEYDITTQSTQVLANPEAIGLSTLGWESLSPDGRFLMGERWNQSGVGQLGLAVCQIK